MNILIVITVLMITGIILLIIEALIVPGFSIPGLAGLAMMGYAVYKASTTYGALGASSTLLVSIVAAVLVIMVALKTRTMRKIGLDYTEKTAKSAKDLSYLIGKTGRAVTTLRPAGTAIFGDERHDVVTEGDYIAENASIRVLDVEGSRVIVILDERS